MTRPPRAMILQLAKIEFLEATTKICEKHDLTYGEVFAALASVLADQASYMLRTEREEAKEKEPNEA